MSEICLGDRVTYLVGHRRSIGRVANRDGEMATIATSAGKMVRRKLSQLVKVPCVVQQTEQPAAVALPACSADAP